MGLFLSTLFLIPLNEVKTDISLFFITIYIIIGAYIHICVYINGCFNNKTWNLPIVPDTLLKWNSLNVQSDFY